MPTVTLQPVEARAIDTWVQDGASTDRSTHATMRVGKNSADKESRILLDFSLTQVLAKTLRAKEISSVTLTLNHASDFNFNSSHTKTLNVAVVDGSFTENATWAYRDGSSTAWTSAGGDVLVAPGSQAITYTGDSDLVITSTNPAAGNLLGQVRDAISNRGFSLRLRISMTITSPNRYTQFHSASATTESDRPKLDITYSRKRIQTPMKSYSNKPSNMRRPRSSR